MSTIEPQLPLAAPQPEAPHLNPFSRMTGALFAPVTTFRDIARKPDFIVVLLLIMVVASVSAIVMSTRLDVAGSVKTTLEQKHMSSEQIDRAVKFATILSKMMMYLAAFLMPLILAAIAGVMLLAFRMFRGEGTFRQAFSITLYAWLPLLLFTVLNAGIAMTRQQIDPKLAGTLVRSSPAFLADVNKQPALFALLSALDIFSFWTLALMTIGYAEMARVSRVRAASIVLTMWALRILFAVGTAALGNIGGHA